MLGCLGREVSAAVVSVVDCVASVVDYEARPMEDAEVMDVVVVGTLLAVATSRTRICIRITRVRTSRRVDTVERMMGGLLEGTVLVMARGLGLGPGRGVTTQSPVNKSWFAT
jgi:hypothetical protein